MMTVQQNECHQNGERWEQSLRQPSGVLLVLSRHPELAYLVLSILVLGFVVSHMCNQRFQGDFWQHSAVVRELSIHPWAPRHPHLPVAARHEFYGPYALMLGLICRATGLGSITVLYLMGLVNLCLLLYGLRVFCLKLAPREATAFFTLLFTLVLWGYRPWMWGQFYHLAAIGDTVSYPSCFSAALSFLIWGKYIDATRKGCRTSLVPLLAFLMAVAFLSHPPTGISMYVGLCAFFLGLHRRLVDKHALIMVIMVLASIVGVLVWPYYRITDLISLGVESQHHDGNRWMYVHVLRNSFGAMIAVAFVPGRLRKNKRDPILIMAGILLALYLFGYFSHRYVLGRVIPYIVFCLHFVTADAFGQIVGRFFSGGSLGRQERVTFALLGMLAAIFAMGFVAAGIYRYRPGRQCTYAQYVFLRDYVTHEDVVLTDLGTSMFVPSFGGKVVATGYPQTFIHDHNERRDAVRRFFDSGTTNEDRWGIVKRYDVDYVLLDKQRVSGQGTEGAIKELGWEVFSNDAFLLINIPGRGSSPFAGVSEE